MSTTQKSKSSATVDLGPASTLEELLNGKEMLSSDVQDQIAQKQAQIKQLQSQPNAPASVMTYDQWVAKNGGLRNSQTKSAYDQYAISAGAQGSNTSGQIKDLQKEIADLQSNSPKQAVGGYLQQGIEQLIGKNTSLDKLLNDYAQSGGLPSKADIAQSNSLAQNLYQARQTELNQAFIDQTQAANQQAAARGLGANDPVLNAKLRTGFMRQQDLLNAEKQAQATEISMGIPGQRIGLLQQGLSNISTLLGQGSQLLGQQQNWRYNIAPKNTTNTQTTSGLGAVTSAIAAPVAGIGSILGGIGTFRQGAAFSNALDPTRAPSNFGGGGGINYNLGGNQLNTGYSGLVPNFFTNSRFG